jgi:membrane protein
VLAFPTREGVTEHAHLDHFVAGQSGGSLRAPGPGLHRRLSMSHSRGDGRLVVAPKADTASTRSQARAVVRRFALRLESTPVGVLWSRLLEVEFVDRAVALAAKLLVSFFPLLVVAAAVARSGVRDAIVGAIMERLGVSGPALDMVRQAFTSPEATRAATGILGVLLTLAYAVSFTTALQRVYLRAWRRPPGGGVRNKGRGALWVGGMLVYIFVLAAMYDLIGGATGTALTWVLSVLAGALLWWWTSWLMLRGEVRWRPLLPTGVVTGVGISIYALGADVWMPVTVSGNFAQFGAFGIALSFVTFFTGIAFVTVIGAVIGPVLAEADDPVGRWLRGGATTALTATAPPSLPGPDRPVRLADAFGRGDRASRIRPPDPDRAPEP